jgi:hypothetical protein
MADVEPMPVGLSAPGKRLWQQVTAAYRLNPAELAVLEEMARTKDYLARFDRLVRALRTADLVVEGSVGQLKAHPAFDQLLRQQLVFGKLSKLLSLPTQPVPTLKGLPGGRGQKAS